MIKKNLNRREDEMQISQPDLRIVPRKQDQTKTAERGQGPKQNTTSCHQQH
jgi:hypothetical protein